MIRKALVEAGQTYARRGARGRGWYYQALKNKEEKAQETMKPYDAVLCGSPAERPQAFFELTMDGNPLGRIVFELANDVVPKTVENFIKLCTNDGEAAFSYRDTVFHQINRSGFVSGGDVLGLNGKGGGHSAFDTKYFEDENFALQFSEPGVLGMASAGIDTNASQFLVTMLPMPHLNGKSVAFGKVIQGMDVLEQVSKIFSVRGKPLAQVKIADCGTV